MITWDVNPEIFHINLLGFNLAPRYYGLAFVIGFFIGEKFMAKKMWDDGYTKKDTSTLFTYVLLGTIIGARLGHCLFYEPAYYLSNPLLIFKVWEGGLASHGGFIGVMVAIYLWNRKSTKKINYVWLLDLIAAPALMTGSFIRIGNLMNSEILGKHTDLPWAFVFKKIDNIPRHPTQLYESFGYFTISMIVYYLYNKFHQVWPRGRFVGIILVGGMSWRFFTEFFKENQVSFEDGMFLNMGQLLSVIMLFFGIYLIIRKKQNKFF